MRRLFAEYDGARADAHAAQVIAQTVCMKLELPHTLTQSAESLEGPAT